MGFKVLADLQDGAGVQVIAEFTDRRVERVGLRGRTGEAGAMRVMPNQTECLLTFDLSPVDGRVTLYDMDAIKNPTLTGDQVQERIDEMQGLPSATNTGVDFILDGMRARESRDAEAKDALLADDAAMRAESEGEGQGEGTAGEGEAQDPVPGDFTLTGTSGGSSEPTA